MGTTLPLWLGFGCVLACALGCSSEEAKPHAAVPAREIPARVCAAPAASCSFDDDCEMPYDVCGRDVTGSRYCTKECETNGDCPVALSQCGLDATDKRVCLRRIDSSADACASASAPELVGRACVADACTHLGDGFLCAVGVGASFCTRNCVSTSDCPKGSYCRSWGGQAGNICVPASCACDEPPGASTITSLITGLQAEGHSWCEVGRPYDDVTALFGTTLGHDPWRLSIFSELYFSPPAVSPAVGQLADDFAAAKADPWPVSAVLRRAAALWDAPVGPLPPLATDPDQSFADAVLAFYAPLDSDEATDQYETIRKDAKDLPRALKQDLVPLLQAILDAINLRDSALSCAEPSELNRFFANTMAMFFAKSSSRDVGERIDLSQEEDRWFLLDTFDETLFVRAALRVSDAAAGMVGKTYSGDFAFDRPTPLGRILIRGSGDDVYAVDPEATDDGVLLVLDVGGNDTYRLPVAGNSSIANPVAVAIDLGGSDTYTYDKVDNPLDTNGRPPSDKHGRYTVVDPVTASEVARQGGANMGIALLADLGGGDDVYESLRFSQGSGLIGVGVLYDDGGNDQYRAEAGSQGAAHFGMGVLIDRAGNDTYSGYSVVQGATHVRGVGLLVDYSGADQYRAQSGDQYIESDQLQPGDDPIYGFGNNQGASWGRRADYPVDRIANGVPSSGGFGGLLDFAGDDVYSCGSFCQGSGYWFGVGLMYDRDGSDQYESRIYDLGAAVHLGLGIFMDEQGNDRYLTEVPNIGLSVGFAHDFGVGFHWDGAGDDIYHGAWQSFGTGSNQAIGILINGTGSDQYQSAHFLGFGMATGLARDPADERNFKRTTGLFFDGGGTDSYSRAPYFDPEVIGDTATWVQVQMETTYAPDGTPLGEPLDPPMPAAFSLGVDTP